MSDLEPLFYDVNSFCAASQISRSFFYKLSRAGKGPAVTKLGNRTVISTAAAKAWRDNMGGVAMAA